MCNSPCQSLSFQPNSDGSDSKLFGFEFNWFTNFNGFLKNHQNRVRLSSGLMGFEQKSALDWLISTIFACKFLNFFIFRVLLNLRFGISNIFRFGVSSLENTSGLTIPNPSLQAVTFTFYLLYLVSSAKKSQPTSKLLRQVSLAEDSVGPLPSISANIVMPSPPSNTNPASGSKGRGSVATSNRGCLKRAMTLPVQTEMPQPLLLGGHKHKYAPLGSPMRGGFRPLVSTSETKETLLDVPLLISSSEEDKKPRNVRHKPSEKATRITCIACIFRYTYNTHIAYLRLVMGGDLNLHELSVKVNVISCFTFWVQRELHIWQFSQFFLSFWVKNSAYFWANSCEIS